MAKVAILLDSEQGHFFHTLQLAQELAQRGHDIWFWSFPEAEQLIRAQGFGFEPITSDTGKPDSLRGTALFGALVRGQLLDHLVDTAKPDVFLTLSIFSTGALALRYRYSIPVVLVRTNLTLLTRMELCQLVVEDLMSMSTEPLELIRLVNRSGTRVRTLAELSNLILKMPEIAMTSREFERGESGGEQGVHYVGGCVNVERTDTKFPWEVISGERKLIYCSSGSQAHLDQGANVCLFQLVINSVKRRPDWQGILAIGNHIDRNLLPCDASNVYITAWAPQIDVLRRSSVMITHAGFNSVRECVALGVPMIAFPMRRDQFNVADRIVKHGLGRKGELSHISEADMTVLIEDVMTSTFHREQLEKMRHEFTRCDVDCMVAVVESAAKHKQIH